MLRWRHFVGAAVSIVLLHPVAALAQDTRWAAPDGAVILFRHANAPGVGDPAERNSPQTVSAMATLKQWRGPGVMVVVVTHQVNITALTGVVPRSGEGVVVKLASNTLQVPGRLVP